MWRIVYHYQKDDEDCVTDYSDIELFRGEKLIVAFGDSYHSRGAEKIQGFLMGVQFCLGVEVIPEIEHIPDRDY